MTNQNSDPRQGMTSASNAQADLLCPGRHQAQRGLPEVPTDYSESGKRIHAALAGEILPDSLRLEDREVFDACREIEKKLIAQYLGDAYDPKDNNGQKVFRHQRYWVKVPYRVRNDFAGEGPSPEVEFITKYFSHSGEADVIHRRGNKALINDYKTLAGDVPESPRNLQLRDLSVLARGNLLVEEVAVAIIQPFVTHSPELCVYNRAALDRAQSEMFARVIASNTPGAPRVAGELQCKFCKAKLSCAEHQAWAGAMVPSMMNLLDVPVTAWTPEQRAMFCERRAVAQKWLDDCEAEMKRLLANDPKAVAGWTLKPGAEREAIINAQEVFNRFIALGGKPEDFVGQCVKVGKTKLREVVNAVTGAKGKSLDKAMETLLEGCTETKQNAPSLVKGETI